MKTARGYERIEFLDRYDHKCYLQKSSIATENCIWFGIANAEPQVMASEAAANGIQTDQTTGWIPYPIPEGVLLTTQMHLTVNRVKELLPILKHFAETGELPEGIEFPLEPDGRDDELILAMIEKR